MTFQIKLPFAVRRHNEYDRGMNAAKPSMILVFGVVLVALLGLSLPFLLIVYSINYGDEPYQILNAMDYKVAPQAPLTYWVSGLWGGVNTFSLISFRTLSAIVADLTVVIGSVYFFYRRRNLVAALFAMGISAMTLALIQQKCYTFGWDKFSNFFIVSNLILLLECYNKKTTFKILGLGFLSACAVLSRIPNIVIIPLIALLLAFAVRTHLCIRWRDVCLYLVASIAFIVLWLIVLYGNPIEYVRVMMANQITDHNVWFVLSRMLGDFVRAFPFYSSCGVIFVLIYFARYSNMRKGYYIISLLVCFLLLFVSLFVHRVVDTYNIGINDYLYGVLIVGLFYVLAKGRRDFGSLCYSAVTIFVFSLIPIVGSNTGMFKVLNVVLFPILAVFLYDVWGSSIRDFCIVVFTSIFCFAPFSKRLALFQDKGIAFASYTFDIDDLKGVWTTNENVEFISRVMSSVQPYRVDGHPVVIVGCNSERFMFEYLMRNRMPFSRHQWDNEMLDNVQYISAMEQHVAASRAGREPVVLLLRKPGSSSLMEARIDSLGWPLEVDSPRFAIYRAVPAAN